MKRTISKLLGIAALAIVSTAASFALVPAANAQTAPTCTPNNTTSTYPRLNGKFQECVPNMVTSRRDEIVNAITQLPAKLQPADPNKVRDSLQQAGITYFYFYDRAAANLWFNAHGYPSIYQDSSARCGNTVGSPTSGIITVAIYDRCTVANNGQFSNPNLRRTTIHETGHAFSLSISKNAGAISNAPDLSTGWKALMTDGINKLTPPQWTNGTWGQSNKDNYLCVTIFGNVAPSALELDFGATSNPVCSGNPLVPIDGNGAKTPRQITEEKLPYFVRNTSGTPTGGSNKELWAELFLIKIDSTAPTQTSFLKLTDQVLGKGSWTSNTANFQCSKLVVQFYVETLAPPSSSDLTLRGCPGTPGSFVTH